MSNRMPKLIWLMPVLSMLTCSVSAYAAIKQTKGDFEDKFRQLDEVLPTPNVYRNAAGEPGHQYWQQKVDYEIDVTLDEAKRRIDASEEITYQNNSPDTLKYLWIQIIGLLVTCKIYKLYKLGYLRCYFEGSDHWVDGHLLN